MTTRCPECATPATAGKPYCGHCGALVAPRPDPAPPATASVPATPAPVAPGPAEAPTPRSGTVPATATMQWLPSRWLIATMALALAVVGLRVIRSDRDDAATAFASFAPPGGAHRSEVALPELTLGMSWQLGGDPRTDVLAPIPLAAPLVEGDRIVTVVPGAVVVHARESSGGLRRFDVPTSGASSARSMADGTIVVMGARDAWFLGPTGIIARTTTRDLADVTPVPLGRAVLVVTELGGLVRLALTPQGVQQQRLSSVDAAAGNAVPRFELGIAAPAFDGLWIGARDRGTEEASLWRLDALTLEPRLRLPLGTRDLPTVAGQGDGTVVIAHDDRVRKFAADGTELWSAAPGPNLEILGIDEGRVLLRHTNGRDVLELVRGQAVARATTVLFDGPRSAVAGGEVMVNGPEQLVALRVFDATVSRRLDGLPLSVAGQDHSIIAWVTLGVSGAPVVRVQPTPDRARGGSLDAIDLPLPIARGCAVAAAGDLVMWHDGGHLHEVAIGAGQARARLAARSSSASMVMADETATVVIDQRGVARRYARGLREGDVLPVGDDPVPGAAIDGDAIVVAGGRGRIASLGATDGYVRSVGVDGMPRWLVRIRDAVASPPVALDGAAAIRQVDGAVAILRDGQFVADVPADARALDQPVLDPRGVLLRDGNGVTAAFPQGDIAWTTPDVAALPGLATDGKVVVARQVDALVGLDRQNGRVLWTTPMRDTADRPTTPLSRPTIAADRVVVAVHDAIVVLDLATGAIVDGTEVMGTLSGPLVPTTIGVVACTAAGDLRLIG